MEYLAALDAGGGSGRCLLVELKTGKMVAAKREWSHPSAAGTMGLGYDLDLADIWNKLGEATREALDKAGAQPGEVLGIAVTSMRNTTILLDGKGEALLAVPNQDARALVESATLAAEKGEEIHARGGHWPSPLFTGTRLAWMLNRAPEALKRAATVLSLSDWIAWLLGGEPVYELSQAGETLLLDLAGGKWDMELVSSLGLPRKIFPPLVSAGTCIGRLSPRAASHLGLKPGTPVAAGGADTQCGLLGAGALNPGDLGIIAGTTLPIQAVTAEPVLDKQGRLWTGRHAVPGLFVLESNGLTAGYVLEWFADLLYCEYRRPLSALLAEASLSSPGASGVYSTLGAHLFDARIIGIPVGHLSLSHMVTPASREGRRHVSRAVLEGIAFSVRANLEQIEETLGGKAEKILVAGGMSRSKLWTRILGDVLDRPLGVAATPEVSALGAAVCAGVGANVFPGLVEGAKALGRLAREHLPGAEADAYRSLYPGWKEAYSLHSSCETHLSGLMAMSLLKGENGTGETPSPRTEYRALVTADMDTDSLSGLSALCRVDHRPWREKMKIYGGGKELAQALAGYHILVTEMDVVDFEALDFSPQLKAIVVCRGNPVNVDLESASAFGIPVIRTPGRNADAVADLTVAFMIMLARNLPRAARFLTEENIRAGDLSRMAEAYLKFRGRELWRKTVGIIGLGEVGKRVALRLRPFGARVLFYDPAVGEEEGALYDAEKTLLDELLARSDFVTLHAPKTEATRGMIGRDAFAGMKKGAFFINTARASLVDYEALREALASGHLAGAALDVFPQEPPASDDPLLRLDNVIATPHVGGNTVEIPAHQGAVVVEQLGKLLRGETPDYLLNPEVMEFFSWEGPRREPAEEDKERLAKRGRPPITS